jgi:hypothetical protein
LLHGEGKVIANFEEAVFTLMEQGGKVNVGQLFKVSLTWISVC